MDGRDISGIKNMKILPGESAHYTGMYGKPYEEEQDELELFTAGTD